MIKHRTSLTEHYDCDLSSSALGVYLATLLKTKDKIDPVMQILRDVLRFQSLTMLPNELSCTAFRPWWQLHVINLAIWQNQIS